MDASELILAALVLLVGGVLAWRSGPLARVVLFLSAVVTSAMLFLPGSQLTAIIGKDAVRTLNRMVADTPWTLSDWLHFAIFVWLGLMLWLGRADLRGWKAWALVVVLAVAAEVAQGLTPERSPRVDDVLLNLAGGMAGLLMGIACVAMAHGGREVGSPVQRPGKR
ncbi:hypothetical protein GCM10007164_07420 [Luteimonas padinae]|uniref:VanZ family protein n=1 Tax=Luteimonas padinae TaxID=1714359 RepID=A0ABV6SYR0_9GAMM|nr:VanZ family protein [Luteimonas padinae]GHD67425.1 hypothetical protein GCM10007164_07420 [Luteimonas padinae]